MQTQTESAHRVLFVDDEPGILTALQRTLRPLRHDIHSEFVGSGADALRLLAAGDFDIVVADIRMPGMDGAALLEAVQRSHPHVLRIVLSGHADLSAALRAVPVAHQFLAKPCDANTLRSVITRTVALHNLLHDRELQTLVAGIREIPMRPKTYDEVGRLLSDTSATSVDIANTVCHDVVLMAKLLKIVNSAFFGLPRRVTSAQMAVNYLGTTMLRSVILATAVATKLGPRAKQLGYDLERAETSGLLSAKLATQFFSEKEQREDAFTAALLQDVGELLLVAEAPASALAAFAHSKTQGMPLWEAERCLQTVTHARVGAYLLGAWGLPYSIVEVVAHHHEPDLLPHEGIRPGRCGSRGLADCRELLAATAAGARARRGISGQVRQGGPSAVADRDGGALVATAQRPGLIGLPRAAKPQS